MLFYERRMEEADIIILLLFNRFSCLYRAYCRYIRYKNTTRPDMAEGCKEKFDLEFVKRKYFFGNILFIKICHHIFMPFKINCSKC